MNTTLCDAPLYASQHFMQQHFKPVLTAFPRVALRWKSNKLHFMLCGVADDVEHIAFHGSRDLCHFLVAARPKPFENSTSNQSSQRFTASLRHGVQMNTTLCDAPLYASQHFMRRSTSNQS